MKKRKFELNHLLKWRNTLDKCIRCGYCYEHCPVFKYTRWETEAPRAKLTMIYGLLSGKLEPSKYMADKIFSCFNCQQCVAACSSGVPLTEIFTDARADFAGTEFDTTGTTSITGYGCANCLTCVRACPHDARYFKDGHIVTDSILCQSCGICMDLCPNQSVSATHKYGTDRIYLNRQITDFLQRKNSKVIVFGCNWSFYPDLQSSSYDLEASYVPIYEQPDPEYKILINMCGGRLTKPLILDPFLENAWGVLVACCPDGECEHEGNVKVTAHVKGMKPVLDALDIDSERLGLVQISHGDKSGFQKAIDAFVERVKVLGSPVSGQSMNQNIRSARNEQTRSVR
ncbi:MAG: hydrogenase iron-sulfur subunit [Desulfamplus sp.]|nr:hydrogenase iron-sulfur subunit [Desulfamplus sp.]